MCYYIIKNNRVEEQQDMFERLNTGMMNHLKPLLIHAKVDKIGVNKVFVDGGFAVSLIPHFFVKKD